MAYAPKAIKYRKGYKYQLARSYSCNVPKGVLQPLEVIETEFIFLSPGGALQIKSGYAWDGPSGPLFDGRRRMRASLVHDALYQLLREEKLPKDARGSADMLFATIAMEDGVPGYRAKLWRWGLSKFASGAAHPNHKKIEWSAP